MRVAGSVAGGVAVVVGVCAAGTILVLGAEHGRPATDDGTYAVPREMAGYSHLTGTVSSSPPGPAVALFQHGFGVELLDFPQAVVLGARGDSYRRVDVAEGRAGGETQGDPAPMLLSPDGRYVAVGDHDTADADVAVVDLTTGETTTHPLPRGRSVVPLAWTSGSGSLAVLLSADPTNPYAGSRITGDVAVLDLADDTSDVLDLDDNAAGAAFSPDGSRLVVERSAPRELSVVDLTDRSGVTLPLDGVLAGPSAWSPDGRLIAVTTVDASPALPGTDQPGAPNGLAFVDATDTGAQVPEPLELSVSGPGRVLAWNGDDEVVVLLSDEEPDVCCGADGATLASVPLDGSQPRPLMHIDDLGSYGVGRFQLASAAGGQVTVVDPDGVDRGPWPWPVRIVASLVVGLLAWSVTRLLVQATARLTRPRAA